MPCSHWTENHNIRSLHDIIMTSYDRIPCLIDCRHASISLVYAPGVSIVLFLTFRDRLPAVKSREASAERHVTAEALPAPVAVRP
jgi:hypothetical protein